MERAKLFLLSLLLLALSSGKSFGESSVTVSFSQTSGNSQTDTLALSYQLETELELWSFSSKGEYLYKRDSGEETANRLKIDNNVSRKLGSRLKVELLNFIFRDPFSGYELRVGIGPGLSYRVTDTLKLITGLTYTYNNYTKSDSSSYTQFESGVSYQRKLKDNLSLNQSLSYQASLREREDYFIHFKAELCSGITQNLSLNLSYQVDYQNLLPEGAKYHTDKTFLVGVSYKF
jgi:putative salt-induced outer membrane protein